MVTTRWWLVLAVASSLLGCSESREVASELAGARVETARVQARALADAHALWSARTGGTCPDSIRALLEYTNRRDARDPWGNDYVLLCGDALPAGAEGAGVRSNGPDGEPGTNDDITSW